MGFTVSIEAARKLRGACPGCGGELPPTTLRTGGTCAKCEEPSPRPATGEPRRPRVAGRHLVRVTREMILGMPAEEVSAASVVTNEIVALDKRFTSLLAFVPVLGLVRIHRSAVHTAEEKRTLSALSIAVTFVVLMALLLSLPHPATRASALEERAHQQIEALRGVVERYRSEHGAYPSQETWHQMSQRADPRFYDPWGRRYRYELGEAGGVTIGSLGRDGTEGGRGEDGDVWYRFSPGGSNP